MKKFHVATVKGKGFSTNATYTREGMELQLHPFLTPDLGGSESPHTLNASTPGTNSIGS